MKVRTELGANRWKEKVAFSYSCVRKGFISPIPFSASKCLRALSPHHHVEAYKLREEPVLNTETQLQNKPSIPCLSTHTHPHCCFCAL